MQFIGDGGHAAVVHELLAELQMIPPYSDDFGFIAVGDNASRKKESETWARLAFPRLVHPYAYVSNSAVIGDGSVVMAHAVVAARATVGKHCIINHGAVIDHDCVIEDYAHIAPGAHLCGHVHIGEGTLVGVGVGIAPGCKIPAWSLVKARRLEIVPLYGN